MVHETTYTVPKDFTPKFYHDAIIKVYNFYMIDTEKEIGKNVEFKAIIKVTLTSVNYKITKVPVVLW